MHLKIIKWVLIFIALSIQSYSYADNITTTFTVSATVQKICNALTASNMTFTYNPLATTPATATNNIQVTCSKGTAYAIALDKGTGTGATFAERVMSGSGGTLKYTLYKPGSTTEVWGDGTSGSSTVSDTGKGASASYAANGSIPSGQTSVSQGNYTDTITVTVTY